MEKPIGVFDSGYGGLTVLKELQAALPSYDFLYLGDNARAPYGSRSFELVYEFTLEAVEYLFSMGCELVILACNTASAKALRTIQQKVLPVKYPEKRVLGVIRPSSEIIGEYTRSNHIGILATEGTVKSNSYLIEIHRFYPMISVTQYACPIWVPLIESGKFNTPEGKAIFKEDIQQLMKLDDKIDTIILACTHYPIIQDILREYVPEHVVILPQGDIVAAKLVDYLRRHPEIESKCSKNGKVYFLTTENAADFNVLASHFLGYEITSRTVKL